MSRDVRSTPQSAEESEPQPTKVGPQLGAGVPLPVALDRAALRAARRGLDANRGGEAGARQLERENERLRARCAELARREALMRHVIEELPFDVGLGDSAGGWLIGSRVGLEEEASVRQSVHWQGEDLQLHYRPTSPAVGEVEAKVSGALAEEATERARELEGMQRMASGIAHELNNLLAVVMGGCEMARLDLPEEGMGRSGIDRVSSAVVRIRELAQGLGLYAGVRKKPGVALELGSQITRACKALEMRGVPRARFELQMDEAPCLVRFREDDLGEMLSALLGYASAVCSGVPGAIAVRVYRSEMLPVGTPTVGRHGDLGEGPFVCLEVRDDGPPLEAAQRERLFEPFRNSKSAGGGAVADMGLSLVSGVVRSYGGVVYAEGGQRGNRLTVVMHASRASGGRLGPVSVRPGQLPRFDIGPVLVVDDDDSVRLGTVRMLQAMGISSRTASDGEQAIATYTRERADLSLVVLDLSLPGTGGQEVLRRLREIDPSVRVLLCTGHDRAVVMEKLAGEEVPPLLLKPFDFARLSSSLKHALGPSSGAQSGLRVTAATRGASLDDTGS